MDRKRPNGILAIAIVAIILGSLGTCGGIVTIVSQLTQSQMREFSRELAAASSMGNEEIRQRQVAMQERVEALSDEWRPAILAHQVLNLIASFVLLFGAIGLLRWKPGAPTAFAAAAIASIAVDIGGGVVSILFQQATAAIMQDYAAGLTAVTPGSPRAMGAMMDASASVGLVMGFLWVIVKLGFYSGALVYVRKPDVRALFAPKGA
jgi:hypothetical protein